MASVNLSSNVMRSWLLGYKFLVLSCSDFMVSYILFNVECLVKVTLKLCFGDKVPTTMFCGTLRFRGTPVDRAGLKPMQPMQLHWAPCHVVWVDCSFLPDTPCT